MVWVFPNGQREMGSIPGRVIPKTQKMVLDAIFLDIQFYKVRIKGKVEQSRERRSSYRKERLQVNPDYGRQLYLLLMLSLWGSYLKLDVTSRPAYFFI